MIPVSLLVASALLGAAPVEPINVQRVAFVSEVAGPRGIDFKETTRIPYKPGASCYQWALQIQPQRRTARIREVFELPAAAPHWGQAPQEKTEVSPSRASAVTELSVSLADGVLAHGWCVSAGDPPGHYKISVFENDALLHRFEFDVYDEIY